MNLQNGYKVIYEKAADDKRTFCASKTGVFADAEEIGRLAVGEYKLIYEKNGQVFGSKTGIPADDDKEFTELKKVFEEGYEEILVPAYAEAITTNADSYGKLVVNGDVVMLNATGTIKYLKSAWGTYGNWVGFRINVPENVDPAVAIYTRPNGKSSKLSEVLDSGKNFASVYSDMSKYGDTATYYMDWNGDGVNDLTITIDVTGATLAEAVPEEVAE